MEKKQTTKATNKNKAEIMRRKRIFKLIKTGVILAAALAFVLFLLCSFVFFKVQTIQIEGLQDDFCGGTHTFSNSCYYADEEIARLCGVDIGDSLVLISKKNIEKDVEKLLQALEQMPCADVCDYSELGRDMGINYETDWYDARHLNRSGAEKFTDFMSIVIAQFGIEPGGNADEALWNERVEKFE